MDDRNIIALLFSRSEDGLQALEKKYGTSCRRIAEGILNDDRDAEECVNDAYISLWSRIPPEKPESLSAYLFQTVRNIAVRRYRKNTAKKRNSAYDVALDELSEVLASPKDVEGEILANELAEQIETFLMSLNKEQRILFVRRYWYSEPIAELADMMGVREKTVSVKLFRIRKKLQQYLTEKGVYIDGT